MKRKIYKLLLNTKQSLFALVLTLFLGSAYAQTNTYNFTAGVQTLVALAGNYQVQCWGANGGAGTFFSGMTPNNNINGGRGGYSTGTITIISPITMFIYVGGQGSNTNAGNNLGGYNGGGNSSSAGFQAGSGGGATHVATLTGVLSSLSASQSAVMIVAGGGGGGGNQSLGGDGGGLNGVQPPNSTQFLNRTPGGGGSQTSGGACFTSGFGAAFGQGGTTTQNLAGGGGGGWYGGCTGDNSTAGGGGSGYIGGVINGITASTVQTGFVSNPVVTGNGYVVITRLCNITLAAPSNPICAGNSATITTNAISNYAWSNGGNTSSIVVSPTVTTSYTLTATSPSNCTAGAVITVTVNNTPTVTAIRSNSAICAGLPVVLSGAGANTYSWTSGVTNGAPYFPTITSDYTVTGTNACGNSTAAVSVTVFVAPTVTASVNNPTVCNGSSVIFIASGNATSYSWSGGVTNNAAFTPNSSGSYTVTGGSANGCSTTAVASVTVLITPTITPVVTPTAICLGVNATLSAVGATGYTWSPGTALNSFSAVVSPILPTLYTLIRTNGACTSTTSVFLQVNPLPTVVGSATPTLICVGDPVVLNVIGGITYTWAPNNFSASNVTLFQTRQASLPLPLQAEVAPRAV